MKNLPFLSELREARMFYDGKDLKGRSADTIAELVYLIIMMLEVMRHEYPSEAKRYANETMSYRPFDCMHYAATDLANLVSVINHQSDFEDKIKVNKSISLPMFAVTRYLDDTRSGRINHNDDAIFFYRLEDYFRLYSHSQFRQLRRDIGDWAKLTYTEKTRNIQLLRRELDKRASNIDIYLWFKSSFRLTESVDNMQEAKSYEYHNELNTALWHNYELKDNVKHALLRISEHFIKFLDVEQFNVIDVIITGSNCAFNYTNDSDIDLHILVDPSNLGENPLTQPFLIAKKSLWNSGHDITVKGFDVELYAEDVTNESNQLVATGIYSLWQDAWVKQPKYDVITVDDQSVQSKADDIKAQIDQLLTSSPDSETVDKLWDHIKKMRRSGLATFGEFSTENLAFKVLRADGYLGILSKLDAEIFDGNLTLEDLD